MSVDPFATATDEAQTEAPTTNAAVVRSDAPTDDKVVVTLKGGSGYDAPWIVVHANSVAEATRILGDEVRPLMDLASKAGKYFAGLGGGTPARQATSAAPAATTAPAKAGDPECPPGWTYKTGSKNGKTWRAYMPPRDSGESPMWLK